MFGREVSRNYEAMIDNLSAEADPKSKGGLYNLIDHNYFANGKNLAPGELKAKIEVLGLSEHDADELADTTV